MFRVLGKAVVAGFDLSDAAYANKSFHAVSPIVQLFSLAFSTDGTKMYIGSTGNIFQYTLSIPWDVSTASYASKNVTVSSQDNTPRGLVFRPNGLTMYMTGDDGNDISQYTLSSAWDISTASFASKALSVAAQANIPCSTYIKSDGTKLYVVDNGSQKVYQYTLATPWDLSTGSYASKSFTFSTQDTNPFGLFFSSDGSKMFMNGLDGDRVWQYNLNTPWDVSTASYASIFFSTATQTTDGRDLQFKPDGSGFYVMSVSNDTIYQYSL